MNVNKITNSFVSVLASFFQTATVQHKLDYLDGYRGYLAITVILSHFTHYFKLTDTYYNNFTRIGVFIGVLGFFVLSAFLLTYRLLIDYERAVTARLSLLKTIQYTIRRFFRIYLTFVVFWTLANTLFVQNPYRSYLGVAKSNGKKYYDGLFLVYFRPSHMWTIPREIKYYFIIPLISFLSIKISSRHWYIFASLFGALIIWIDLINFKITSKPFHKPYMFMSNTVFMKGSLIGILYFYLKKSEKFCQYMGKSIIQALLAITLILLTILQIRYGSKNWNPKIDKMHDSVKSGYIAGALFLTMLFTKPSNILVRFYSNCFLRSYGKFSFGIYLYHYGVIRFMYEHRRHVPSTFTCLTLIILISYIIGFIWYYCVEHVFMKIANYLCKKLETSLKIFQSLDRQHFNSEAMRELVVTKQEKLDHN